MTGKMSGKSIRSLILIIILIQAGVTASYARQTSDTLKGKHIYHPQQLGAKDTIISNVQTEDTLFQPGDSLQEIRLKYIRDSLLAREQFIRDSIQRRQRMLDSLNFLKRELPVLLDAYLKTIREDIIVHNNTVSIIGDSVLSDYSYVYLLFNLTQPYTPWKVRYKLTDNSVKIFTDKARQKIVSVQASFMNCTFSYGNPKDVMVIHELSRIQRDKWGQFYITPFDSVFFDHYKRVYKIKRYLQLYAVTSSNQRGEALFINLSQVKQYEYGPDNRLTLYQVVNFCDRWKAYEASKVCNIITHKLSKQGHTYLLTRRNDPANTYSDGTFTFEFDGDQNLRSVSFHNLSNTENWQRIVELNAEGNVNCYIDKTKDIVRQSLCMIYNHKNPAAKHKVETVTTIFEEDGISYYQKNNTTGLSRVRDRLTLEWGPWR
ncbi:MAG: hypothetical protein JXK95_11430 [Bacteroidales bacterium]|nr:hypothetical protein [Bacteroidales bacterium]